MFNKILSFCFPRTCQSLQADARANGYASAIHDILVLKDKIYLAPITIHQIKGEAVNITNCAFLSDAKEPMLSLEETAPAVVVSGYADGLSSLGQATVVGSPS